jgi:hypothetical protein
MNLLRPGPNYQSEGATILLALAQLHELHNERKAQLKKQTLPKAVEVAASEVSDDKTNIDSNVEHTLSSDTREDNKDTTSETTTSKTDTNANTLDSGVPTHISTVDEADKKASSSSNGPSRRSVLRNIANVFGAGKATI